MLIGLIGPVRMIVAGQPTAIAAPKRACVLAVLASRPGIPVSKEDLIDRVWDGDPPESALSALYSYITRLRAALRNRPDADIDRAGAQGYVLRTATEQVDVHMMRRYAVQAGELREDGRLREALELWRDASALADGEALVGIGGRWAEEFRAGFHRERLNVLAERFEVELALGHHATAVDELNAHVAADPLAEALVARLMLAFYRCGRSAEALKCFETTRVGLRDGLGADPSPELRQLHRRILGQDPELDVPAVVTGAAPSPKAAKPVPAQLPAATPGFLGRDEEVTAVSRQATATGLVVVDGMAGVGKTALAVHTARLLAPRYPDGQLYLDLRGFAGGVQPMPPEHALEQLLRSIDADVPDNAEERAAAWRTALAGRRMLLLFDNARDAAQVAPLLPASPGCLTLVTSRRRLVDLVDARPVSLGTLPAEQAARLFAAETGTDAADPTVEAITVACGRLPLALRIAASRLRNRSTWTPRDLLSRLTEGRDILQRGVFAAFDLSYSELDDTAQRLFRLLSVYPGPEFDRHTAATLAEISAGDAESVLEHLVDAHLLLEGGPGGYRIHDLLRQYARESIVDDAERDQALRRLTEAYIWSAHRSIKKVAPETPLLGLVTPAPSTRPAPEDLATAEEWLRTGLPTIRQLIDENLDIGDTAHAIELITVSLTYLNLYGGATERRRLAELGVEAARALGSPLAEGRLVSQLGYAYRDLAEFELAIEQAQRSAQLRAEAGDPRGEFVLQYDTGLIRAKQGRFAEAADLFSRAAATATAQGDTRAETHIRDHAVGVLARLGRIPEARAELARVEELLAGSTDERAVNGLGNLHGAIAYMSGDYATAIAAFGSDLAYIRAHGHPFALAATLSFLTDALIDAGRHDEALDHALEQLEILDGHHRPYQDATALRQIGTAQAGLARHDEAVDNLHAAIALATDIGAEWIRAAAEHTLGVVLSELGDTVAAMAHLKSALVYFAEGGFPEAARIAERLSTMDSD